VNIVRGDRSWQALAISEQNFRGLRSYRNQALSSDLRANADINGGRRWQPLAQTHPLQALGLMERAKESIRKERFIALKNGHELLNVPGSNCGWNSGVENCTLKLQIEVAQKSFFVLGRIQSGGDGSRL
jgi:hypothetical protein